MRKLLTSLIIGGMLLVGGAEMASAQEQTGLVNVNVGDVTVLENVAVGVAAQVVAQVCGVRVGPIAVLATQVIRTGEESREICEATLEGETGPITIAPANDSQSSEQSLNGASGLAQGAEVHAVVQRQ